MTWNPSQRVVDWHDNWMPTEDVMSNVWLLADTHLNHDQIKTYCQRPEDFTQRIHRNVMSTVKPGDTLLHLGDVGIGDAEGFMELVRQWPGHKVLVRGNHDSKSCQWYVDHGFDMACDAMVYRSCWLTHRPWTDPLPKGTNLNLHGHLHNVWDGFLAHDETQADEFYEAYKSGKLPREYNRLFSVEYTDYRPVEFNKFVAKPDKYKARGRLTARAADGPELIKYLTPSVPQADGNSTDGE